MISIIFALVFMYMNLRLELDNSVELCIAHAVRECCIGIAGPHVVRFPPKGQQLHFSQLLSWLGLIKYTKFHSTFPSPNPFNSSTVSYID